MTGTKPAQARRISGDDAAALVRSGDWVEYGTGVGQPDVFDTALARRVDDIEDVKIRACLTLRPRAVLDADPGRDHFHWFNWHYTGYDRAKADGGLASYIPCNLGEIPDYYRRFIEPPEVAVLKTCPKDERGCFNFSLAAFWRRAIVERAKLEIVEESAGLPYVDGLENSAVFGDRPSIRRYSRNCSAAPTTRCSRSTTVHARSPPGSTTRCVQHAAPGEVVRAGSAIGGRGLCRSRRTFSASGADERRGHRQTAPVHHRHPHLTDNSYATGKPGSRDAS